jgi:microcin C transport system substrate-binding protein
MADEEARYDHGREHGMEVWATPSLRWVSVATLMCIGSALADDKRFGDSRESEADQIEDICAPAHDYEHGFAHLFDLKYSPDFEHFAWVNPDAPKGGTIRIPQMGSYDSFNPFIDRGQQAAGMGILSTTNLLYDRLMALTADEPVSWYGQLAQGVKVADDFRWIAFKLREGAYWHDGVPITIDDLIFSFEFYKTQAAAWVQTMIADVDRIEQIGCREVHYVMVQDITPNPSIAVEIGLLPVIPKHYWEERELSRTTTVPPLGSGQYRVADWRIGRYVTFERVENYWGRDLPVMRGRFNFDVVKYDYFRDEQVILEAHRGHIVDIRSDGNAKNWATEYDFPAVHAGLFRQELIPGTSPVGLSWPIFWNKRHERFQDIRVREALWLLYDFEWINRVIHYGFYERGRSLFHGAPEMEASGLPSEEERHLLEPWREYLPERMFTEPYRPPVNSGHGLDRAHLERAIDLFAEAGWIVRNGRLLHAQTGERFRIQFVLVSHNQARALLPYLDQLKRVGIDAFVRVPEASNWLYRMQTSAFDASQAGMPPYRTPGLAFRNHFGSASAELGFGVNWGYVRNPAIDELAERVIGATDLETFLAAVNAADRILLWNFYFIPGPASRGTPLVWWDKFGRPDAGPLERVSWLDSWWWDEEKARRVDSWFADRATGE